MTGLSYAACALLLTCCGLVGYTAIRDIVRNLRADRVRGKARRAAM